MKNARSKLILEVKTGHRDGVDSEDEWEDKAYELIEAALSGSSYMMDAWLMADRIGEAASIEQVADFYGDTLSVTNNRKISGRLVTTLWPAYTVSEIKAVHKASHT